VRRRPAGRDAGLSTRMAAATAVLLLLYAAIVATLVVFYVARPRWTPWITIVAVAVGWTAVAQYRSAESILLRSVGAKISHPTDEAHLHDRLERLAALADVPTPRFAVLESDDANAFTVGVTPGRAVIVVTTSLLQVLDDGELDAALAHELSHVANRDAAVMTWTSVPRTVGTVLVGGGSGDVAFLLWFFVWPLGLPPWVLGSLLTLAMSRYREFVADRGSALITGRPEALMSALMKLARATPSQRDLRAVEALCIVPARTRARFSWLMDHPPLERRLAALEKLSRELGRPVT
jgi:heat shock protein HtpX